MKKNVKIARELVKLAKEISAFDFSAYEAFDEIKSIVTPGQDREVDEVDRRIRESLEAGHFDSPSIELYAQHLYPEEYKKAMNKGL